MAPGGGDGRFHSPLPSRRGSDSETKCCGDGVPTCPRTIVARQYRIQSDGLGLKESCDGLQLLAGDRLDIAYSLGMNEHPEFGGLELTLRDVVRAGERTPEWLPTCARLGQPRAAVLCLPVFDKKPIHLYSAGS
jgi:hypothetical protein